MIPTLMDEQPEPETMSTAQVMVALGYDRSTIVRMAQTGRLSARRHPSGGWMFATADVRAVLADRRRDLESVLQRLGEMT